MERPDHVPADLVVDFDFANFDGGSADLHAAYVKARDAAPDMWLTGVSKNPRTTELT